MLLKTNKIYSFFIKSLLPILLLLGVSSCSRIGLSFHNHKLYKQVFEQKALPSKNNREIFDLSRRQHQLIENFGSEYKNVKIEKTLQHILYRLCLASFGRAFSYHIALLNSPHVNAFALPDGRVYITRGLLALATSPSEIAAVLAHELAHISAHHTLLRHKEAQHIAQINAAHLAFLQNTEEQNSLLLKARSELAQFSRNQELEADHIATNMLYKAGYNPFAMANILQSMQSYSNFYKNTLSVDKKLDFLAFHPSTPERITYSIAFAKKLTHQDKAPLEKQSFQTRNHFVSTIDGLLFSDVAANGYLRDNQFIYRQLHISFTLPKGFNIHHTQNV